ncbi:NAD-dependent epimerase/dehydratase family protein [Thiovibrio frasassiensis]|uniref:NAD-dependent epimerase/dehydratase family protein n=1 Tax=Thiovibrio frasassiensis TaxID=2984131 RepID=A0A9X4MG10_9BACT|nr:NAD-dependent epimerase/dehydratase family protein [Thiovibrio frasassiensis]MDG4476581.1 NAD-dependent epimerase/dehydratase family protein [Thiovibrio frasassiensis]
MQRVLVLGGSGFVGRALVQRLVADGVETAVLARRAFPEAEVLGVRVFSGDICDLDFLTNSLAGYDTVIHLASKAGIWGDKNEYYQTNVSGTQNVIDACRANAISVLVYASTPGVVYQKDDLCGVNERTPYARNFLSDYARSKAIAEKMVLDANAEGLKTIALRPHLIWGPGDTDLIPRLLGQARCRQLKRVGDGHNLVDVTYIDNAVDAFVLAAKNLHGQATGAGKPYFISQGEPVNLWNWLNKFFRRLDIPIVEESISFHKAYLAGVVMEAFCTLSKRKKEPCMTRFLAVQLAKSHWFSIENANRDLGYFPKVSTGEGINTILQWVNKSQL